MRKILIIIFLKASLYLSAQTADELLVKGNQYYEKKDYATACDYYQKSAELGNAEAQFNLGFAYYNGEGVERNYTTATMWFKRSAKQNFAKAEYNLAYCYLYGRGVPHDYDKALAFLESSANSGFKQAQITLSDCYEKGILVEKNKEISDKWRNIAENGGKVTSTQTNIIYNKPKKEKTQTVNELQKPIIRILYPENNTRFHTRTLKIKYQLVAPNLEKQTKISVMVDGVKQSTTRAVHSANMIEVDLPNRDCIVKLHAQNRNGVGESDEIQLVKEEEKEELPRLLAVVVGVGDYQDELLSPLSFSYKDACDFAKAISQKKNKPFSDIQIKILTNSEAKRNDLYEAFEWMQEEAKSQDICVFFFAGHGYKDMNNKFYFMTYGSDTKHLYTGFSAEDFRAATENIVGKFVVFVDACYAGSLGNDSPSSFAMQLNRAKNGIMIYASSSSDTKSREDERWKNGIFTRTLIRAFCGQARNEGDKALSTQRLENFLYKEVREATEYKQTPVFINPSGIEHFNLFNYE